MSDDKLEELLRKNVEISERTLQLVQKLHRAALWARFFSFLKWTLIIAFTVWGYLAIQPYLNQLLGLSGSIPKEFDIGGLLKNIGQ